jgi:phosphoglucomutase
MKISPLAGKPAPLALLVDVPRLIDAYYSGIPDPAIPGQRIVFGTSGHRGSSLTLSFNERHILAITQAICMYRSRVNITGPLFMGFDTHALSRPAFATALEVLAANGVNTKIATDDEFTPTPAVSHAILTHNSGRLSGRADGIVITPSHNPPHDGGFKYNPPSGGPAPSEVTDWIEATANTLLEGKVAHVKRIPFIRALRSPTTERHDFLGAFVEDLDNVVAMEVIRSSGIRLGVDPLGGAGVHYWARIADRHRLNLTVVSEVVDPTFRFMTVDWDGQIRMDPSSPYAMRRLIGMKDSFDISFACDTDHDRHGIVTRGAGLLPPNHYLAVCISYLFQNRPLWTRPSSVGKTVVSSTMIDRVTAKLGGKLFEVPVGFKWFVDGLLEGSLVFAGEESAGSTFDRLEGSVWTTDKDGFAPCLLSAEMTARTGVDPGNAYKALAGEFGETYYGRIDAPATPAQRATLAALSPAGVGLEELAGEKVVSIVSRAPGNGAHLGGIKVATAGGWFAARPSGTENIYKIYAESFHGTAHLRRLQDEAQLVVNKALSCSPGHGGPSGPVGEPGAESKVVRTQRGFRVGAGATQAAPHSR